MDKNENYVIRATAAGDYIRAFAVTCAGVTEEARRRHDLSPVTTAALGRVMAAALMMGYDLKNEKDMLTIQYDCDGPIGGITVTSDSQGHVKGYVHNPHAMLPANAIGKLDVGGIVGHGLLRIMKDIGLKDAYNGTVEIQSGEIGEDLAYYFAVSEQVPSVVSLGVLVDTEDYHVLQTGGFLIQLMPDCPDEIAQKLEETCRSLPQITTLLREGEIPETILDKVLAGLGEDGSDEQGSSSSPGGQESSSSPGGQENSSSPGGQENNTSPGGQENSSSPGGQANSSSPDRQGSSVRILDKRPVSFQCDCSRQRVEKALLAMGDVELYSLIKENKPVTLNCGFCNTDYTFTIPELEALRKRGRTPIQKTEADQD